MTMITVSGLRHTYHSGDRARDTHALGDVSFTVQTGQIVCVVGPSGCGKSTLLAALSGELVPNGGTITFDGHPMDVASPTLALVPQDYRASLAPWLTAQGNVELPLRRGLMDAIRRRGTRIDKAARRTSARHALDIVGLPDRYQSYPSELSGGMAQRVALARALVVRPALLLMDEPFASVDAHTRAGLEDLLLKVQRTHGMTIVLVTHDIDEAVYLADTVVVLSGAGHSTVIDTVTGNLPHPRDQLRTRAASEFVELRTRVAAHLLGPALTA